MLGIIKTKWIRALCVVATLAAALVSVAPVAAFAADNPLSITVSQVFTASSDTADATFSYRLKPLGTGYPMPAGSTAEGYAFTIEGNGSVLLGPLDFGRQSVCRYELFQVVARERPGYAYDTRMYVIEVYGSPEGRVESVILNKGGTKSAAIVFENSYSALASDPRLMADPPVKKTVDGSPASPGTFTFRLAPRDPSYPMPAGSADGAKTVTITGEGESEFGVWSYTRAGTYHYTVTEVNAGENGYSYDTAAYTITDTVRDEGGRLVLSRVVTNHANKQVTSMSFVNKYGGMLGISNSGASSPAGLAGNGPKTGDDMNAALYTILLIAGGALATGAGVYLATDRKRRKDAGRA